VPSASTVPRKHAETAVGLARLMTQARRVRLPKGLSSTAMTTLDTLSFAGPLRVTELAEREGVTQPAMTGLVNRLESGGLVTRAADPSDGRAALVAITDSGVTFVEQSRADRARVLSEHIDRLDDADQQALLAALPALHRLTADLADDPFPTESRNS
jgi:DNA-binding MarR family transcriptional regulator